MTHMTCTVAPQPEKASRSTAFNSVCDIVSKSSSGPYWMTCEDVATFAKVTKQKHTRSGSQSDSAIPNNLSLAVPATTKSFGRVKHPIRSVPAMKGLLPSEGFDNPAMIGSTK